MIVSASSDLIKFWDLSNGRVILTIEETNCVINSMAISHDGNTLACGSDQDTILLFDLKAMENVLSDLNTSNVVSSLDEIRDVMNNFYILEGHSNSVSSVVITPDSKILVSGSYDGTIKIWNLSERTLLRTLKGDSNTVNSVAMTSDCKYIVSGGNDCQIRVWGVRISSREKELKKALGKPREISDSDLVGLILRNHQSL